MEDEARIAEKQILALMEDAAQDRERAAQRRLVAAQQEQAADDQFKMLEGTLDVLRRKHGLPAPERAVVSAEQASEYYHKTAREIVTLWADQHNDEVVIKAMYQHLVDIGMFKDVNEAHRTLSRIYARMPELKRVSRGIYRRQPVPVSDSTIPIPTAPDHSPRAPLAAFPASTDGNTRDHAAMEEPWPRQPSMGLAPQLRTGVAVPTLRGLPADAPRG